MLQTTHNPTYHFPLCLTPEEMADPKLVIGNLFTIYPLPMARGLLETWRKKAFSSRQLGRKTLLSVLELKGHLVGLLEASTLLIDKGESTLDLNEYGIMDTGHYFIRDGEREDAFDYFPRYLSRDEYINPYRVLEKGRRQYTLPQWREWLLDFWSAGTTRSTIYELCEPSYPERCTRLLFQHLEAAYLIFVREFYHGENV